MAIKEFEYSKNWNNPADFPTFEASEEQVRADMQWLFDDIKRYLNEDLAPEIDDVSLPTGGVKGQALMKLSSADGDVAWQFPPTAGGEGGGTTIVEAGGYYVPYVEDGVLKWTPSHSELPEVPDSDVRGPAGPQGPRGEDGLAGAAGARGPQGPIGPQGRAGHTPERGVDYWTEVDKQTIVNEAVQRILEELPNGDEVEY